MKQVKKNWNNFKGSSKAGVDCSCREGGSNEAGEVEDEDILILSSHKENVSVTERESQMLSFTPALTGISGSVDLFQPPTTLLTQTEIIEASDVTPVFERPEVTVSSRRVRNRKCKRSIEQPNHMISV